MRKEIVITGSGGQGIQTAGMVLAQALCKKGFLASFNSIYGPEARGGASACQIVIKEFHEDWPEVLSIDILIAMSQDGYKMWTHKLSQQCAVIFDKDMVNFGSSSFSHQYPISATKIAEQLGTRMVATMVMLGAACAISELLTAKELNGFVREMGKKSSLNIEAIEKGYMEGKAIFL